MKISDQTLNRLTTLKALRRHAPVSRSDLPRLTGLSGGTITQLTADLLQRGLIVERKEDIRRSGRPRTFLSMNHDSAIVIGASMNGSGGVDIAYVDLAGTLLHADTQTYSAPHSIEAIALALADCLNRSMLAAPIARERIERIGMAIHGMVDTVRGDLHFLATFPPQMVPFARLVSERTGIPVTIENVTAGHARAEHWFGRAQDLETFTLIDVDLALGTAEYADGVAHYGANGLNPEIGHMKTDYGPDAPPCICGARGCATVHASIAGILQKMNLLPDLPDMARMTFRQAYEIFNGVLDRADAGDRQALSLLDSAATHLGYALANHVNIKDPGTVIITVAGERFLRHLEPRFREVLAANLMPGTQAVTDFRMMTADSRWWQQGTAALALEQTYLAGETRHMQTRAKARQPA